MCPDWFAIRQLDFKWSKALKFQSEKKQKQQNKQKTSIQEQQNPQNSF